MDPIPTNTSAARDPTSVDADIARAETLPGTWYHDPGVFAEQREKIFARAWHLVADLHRVKAPGHVLPVDVLPGCLDEPLVVTRDRDDTLHCLSNVCTHRGALVVEGEGHVNSLRCRYHGRRFGLDGSFQHMPEFEDVVGFPRPCDDLPRLKTGQWGPFLFASLDPGYPFDDWIGPIQERCGWLPLERARFDPHRARDYLISANWALYCDNYLEGFHVPYVHSTSLAELDYGSYRTEVFAWSNLQLGIANSDDSTFDLPADHPDAGEHVAAFYFWHFPNLMLNVYPWGISVNVVEPLDVDRTRVRFLPYVWDPDLLDQGVGSDLHRVEMEDEEVVESQHRGLGSRLYRRGRFSPRREVGTHHFHRLLAATLNRSP